MFYPLFVSVSPWDLYQYISHLFFLWPMWEASVTCLSWATERSFNTIYLNLFSGIHFYFQLCLLYFLMKEDFHMILCTWPSWWRPGENSAKILQATNVPFIFPCPSLPLPLIAILHAAWDPQSEQRCSTVLVLPSLLTSQVCTFVDKYSCGLHSTLLPECYLLPLGSL